jgi:hypothetical protein
MIFPAEAGCQERIAASDGVCRFTAARPARSFLQPSFLTFLAIFFLIFS